MLVKDILHLTHDNQDFRLTIYTFGAVKRLFREYITNDSFLGDYKGLNEFMNKKLAAVEFGDRWLDLILDIGEEMLSWSELEGTAVKNNLTAYLCCDDFETVRKDVKQDNPDISVANHKIETMWRLLNENLDYGVYNESENEDENTHQTNMEKRAMLCDKVAVSWCNGEIDSLEKANEYLKKLLIVK